jgi:hypothetical protein
MKVKRKVVEKWRGIEWWWRNEEWLKERDGVGEKKLMEGEYRKTSLKKALQE